MNDDGGKTIQAHYFNISSVWIFGLTATEDTQNLTQKR